MKAAAAPTNHERPLSPSLTPLLLMSGPVFVAAAGLVPVAVFINILWEDDIVAEATALPEGATTAVEPALEQDEQGTVFMVVELII